MSFVMKNTKNRRIRVVRDVFPLIPPCDALPCSPHQAPIVSPKAQEARERVLAREGT